MLSIWISIGLMAKEAVKRVDACLREKEIMIGKQNLDKQQQIVISEQLRVKYEKELLSEQMALFRQSSTAQEDRKKASILAASLEEKFSKDLGIGDGPRSDSEVIAKLNGWIQGGFSQI